jgi:flagellar biosynthesis anti-sigma factor FlgM
VPVLFKEGVVHMEIQGNSATPTMVVNHPQTPAADVGAPAGQSGRTGQTGQTPERGAGGARETRVALSEKARSMLAIKQAADGAPDVRESRVAELKERVDAGTYNVEGRLVARAVAREALIEAVV